ncbi:HAD-like domain-containing protein [Mycena filopes]|nr:HAD-like domain-containing protein [Mycena filopes]
MKRCTWAVISPSPLDTLAQLNSDFALSAARDVECHQYLALILEKDRNEYATSLTWLAFLVQPITAGPLPDAYLPIWPCTTGPRAPINPGFDWPFGDCVLRTGDPLLFTPTITDPRNPVVLPQPDADRFREIFLADREELERQMFLTKKARMREERDAAGLSSESESTWTNFSAHSTRIAIQPGELFRPLVHISADVCYEVAPFFTPRDQLEQDRKSIMRIFARFSQLSTESTVGWVVATRSETYEPLALQEDSGSIPDLCAPLLEFSSQLERCWSPDRVETPTNEQDQDYEDDYPYPELPSAPAPSLPPPASFDIDSLRVTYFDIYGTLIDKETGVFVALQRLLERSSFQFGRREALSFYFESEVEVKRRTPGARYAQILTEAYEDVALRLGIPLQDTSDSSFFAESIKQWPLMPLAEWCLINLRHIPAISLVALADVDHESLLQTPAFTILAPFFDAVFTWDACKTYKPDVAAFAAPLAYYDALGVPRAHTCLVSTHLLSDMEPARKLGVPALWMRFPGSLAGHVWTQENASIAWASDDFPTLVADLLHPNNTLVTSSPAVPPDLL